MSKSTDPNADQWTIVSRLLPITDKKVDYLHITANRLRALPPDRAWAESLETNVEHGEMLDAFAARFGRLQDTLGDKLLPAVLRAGQERTGPQLDNLLRAEKLGWIDSAERWIELRGLRNRLIHEYIESLDDLLEAVHAALDGVSVLTDARKRLAAYAQRFLNDRQNHASDNP